MLIRLTDISPEGLIVNDIIPLEALNARMNEGRDNDIFFLQAPKVSITIKRALSGAESQGLVTTRYRQPCALCAKELERSLEVPLNFIFKPKPAHADFEDDQFIDDVGIIYFEGEHIDLEIVIQESLILALSPFLQPERDAKGCCRECGVDPCTLFSSPAEKQNRSFGELIKKALTPESEKD